MSFFTIEPPFTIRKVSTRRFKKWMGSLIILALFSYAFFDQVLSQTITTEKHPWLYRPIRELTEFAEGKYYFVAVILILTIGLVTRQKYWREWGKFSLYALIFSGVLLQILKHTVGRQRPHVSAVLDPHIFHGFTGNWHFHSFPSGHAQTAFSFATLLWLTYPQHRKIFFTIAAALALTRLPLEEHFLSDVLMGAALGISGVLWVAKKVRMVEFTP